MHRFTLHVCMDDDDTNETPIAQINHQKGSSVVVTEIQK